MQLGDLDQLVGILSADLHLKMVPGYSWIPDRLTRKITYPRAQLMTMDDTDATGWIFRCVEHCVSTFGDLDAYSVGVDAALTIRETAGVEIIHPRFFLHVALMAERERVEAIARRRARNLENTYLPRRWQRFRESERIADRTRLATISPMDNPADYWERVGLAVALLAADAISTADLPSDMRWAPDVVARIQRVPALATYDEVLTEIEDLMPAFVRSQLEEHAAPEEARSEEPGAEESESKDDTEPPPETPTDETEPESSDDTDSSDEGDSADEDDESDPTANPDADGSTDEKGDTPADKHDSEASTDDVPESQDESTKEGADPDADTDGDQNDSPSASDEPADGSQGNEPAETSQGDEPADDSKGDDPAHGSKGGSADASGDAESDSDEGPGDEAEPTTDGDATNVSAGNAGSVSGEGEAGESIADLIARIAPGLLEKLQEAIDAEPDGRLEIDFINDDSAADPVRSPEHYTPPTEDEFRNSLIPAWGAVSRSAINRQLREPLRRTLLKHLIDNEVGELETGHRSGRLDVRAVARPDPQPQPFRRRQAKADQSYAVGLIADASGSMNAGCPEIEHDEAVFGEGYPRRWHLTTYLAVALTEALTVIPATQLTVVTYDTRVSFVKPHSMPLTADVRQKILRGIVARGENDDAGALTAAIDDLIRATNTTKMLFHLTDGEFCSGQSAIQYQLNRAKKHGITVVFLTLAIEPTSARRFVDAELADRVDPGTIGPVINKHLTRMLRGQRVAA